MYRPGCKGMEGGWELQCLFGIRRAKNMNFLPYLKKRNVKYHMENSGVMGTWVTRFDIYHGNKF
jgi:hypothetical protein